MAMGLEAALEIGGAVANDDALASTGADKDKF